ncbi:MAG: hypothetical protein K2V38_06080, partial [Gemmataceae bacterium]|nr:hypothetical protein [Gemmataceae bacterium]
MPKGEANPPAERGADGSRRRRAEFEALYEQHSREVWALAYARWTDSDLAMDITQEAFLRLWKQWEATDAHNATTSGTGDSATSGHSTGGSGQSTGGSGEEIQNPRAWLL